MNRLLHVLRSPQFWLGLLAVAIFGCGGGGGGGGGGGVTDGTNGSGSGAYQNVHITAAYATTHIPANLLQLAPGEQIQLDVVGTDPTSGDVVVLTTSFTDTSPSSVSTVAGNGVLSVKAGSTTSYKVTSSWAGKPLSATFTVSTAATTHLIGYIRDIVSNPVGGALFDFYNSAGAIVGTATSAKDGSLVASPPVSAVSFAVNLSSLSTSYYNQFNYNDLGYSVTVTGCRAPLPALGLGKISFLAGDVVVFDLSSGSPPPPPSGCGA